MLPLDINNFGLLLPSPLLEEAQENEVLLPGRFEADRARA